MMGIGPGMGRVDVNQEFKFTVKLKNIGGGGGLTGGCDPRIEAILKLKSRGSDCVGVG